MPKTARSSDCESETVSSYYPLENSGEPLFVGKENEPAIDNFNLCAKNGLAGLFTEEKSRRGITVHVLLLQTRKFVEEMKQEYRSTARSRRRAEVFKNDISQM